MGILNQNSNTVIYEKCCTYLSINIFRVRQACLFWAVLLSLGKNYPFGVFCEFKKGNLRIFLGNP